MNAMWTTFYSYKGGVGRSMAVANIASVLAREGRKVVLIDFDLEAPGLDSFEEFKECSFKSGIVEYVDHYIHSGSPDSIDNYIHNCTNETSSPGEIWVMPSGNKKESYNSKLSSINWKSLYSNLNGEMFFANFKAEINKKIKPDYVIIDSRTGLTDVGGICTMQLPDLVVLMFALNKQNLDGISRVSKAIQNAQVERPPQIHFVASPLPLLPTQRRDLLHDRFKNIKNELGINLEEMSIIRYAPEVAVREKIFIDGAGTRNSILNDYKDLAVELQKFSRSGIDFLKGQVRRVISQQDEVKASAIYSILKEDFSHVADSFLLRYELKPLTTSTDSREELLLDCLKLNPLNKKAFHNIVSFYNKASDSQPYKIVELCEGILGRVTGSSRFDYLFEMANAQMGCQNYEEAIRTYEEIIEKHKKELFPARRLVVNFNITEAFRLTNKFISEESWLEIIKTYEAIGQSESNYAEQANRYQLMHIPYFLVGNFAKAKELLLKAEAAARALSDLDEIFTVYIYRNVNQVGFLAINSQMIASLSKGYLFDDPSRPEK